MIKLVCQWVQDNLRKVFYYYHSKPISFSSLQNLVHKKLVVFTSAGEKSDLLVTLRKRIVKLVYFRQFIYFIF